jgi:transketolase
MSVNQKKLKDIANEVRKHILNMSFRAQSAHMGGALSCVEIMVSLYFHVMKIFPKDPNNDQRDRMVFSKAHDAKVLYAVLAEKGFFDKKILEKYEIDDGILPGHSTRHCVPGVEISAGSLGHGLSIAVGMAYIGKLDGKKHKIYSVISDGEFEEGSTMEAMLFAGHHKLDNLTVIVDYNKLQGFGRVKDVLDLEPFGDKWRAFGWEVKEINGHDFDEIIPTLLSSPFSASKPSVVVAHTIKGKDGVPLYVDQISSQYKAPTKEELKKALLELKKS